MYTAFSTSDVAEGKVFLRDYLQQSSLGDVLRRTRDLSDLGAILAQLPPLEMYMPVPTHRATWDGSGDVLVAGTLSERGDVLGFSTDGRAIPLRGDVPPQLPTIVLVPSEAFHSDGTVRARSALPHSESGLRPLALREECNPEDIYCEPTEPGGGTWKLPPGAATQRGIGIREFISHMKTPNDHEPWTLGAPEFRVFVAGTSTAGATTLSHDINIPEGIWDGSSDSGNAKWREASTPIALMDIDTDYGTRVQVKCMEEDWDLPGTTQITVSGTTTLQGIPVTFSAQFTTNSSSDDCGSYAMLLRTTSGSWTNIPTLFTALTSGVWSGTSDLHWVGYGMSL